MSGIRLSQYYSNSFMSLMDVIYRSPPSCQCTWDQGRSETKGSCCRWGSCRREGSGATPKRQRPRCSFVWFIMETDTSDKESSLHFQYKTLIQNKTSQKLRQVTLDRFFKWSRSNIKCTNVGMWSLRGDLARCKIRMPLCQSVSRGPCSKARD